MKKSVSFLAVFLRLIRGRNIPTLQNMTDNKKTYLLLGALWALLLVLAASAPAGPA